MILKTLSIINYKNLRQAELQFAPKFNCFIGNNGMGKTNLLDAVYYLSFCKSYTNPIDSQIITHGEDVCMLQGRYLKEDGTEEEVYSGIRRRQKKQFKRNKKEYERLSDHIGLIPLVMISPTDNELITGPSGEDVFMDMAIQFDKDICAHWYGIILQQRNVLLRTRRELIRRLELWEQLQQRVTVFTKHERSLYAYTYI